MDSDPEFRVIRIRTQEKKFDPDPEKTGSETLVLSYWFLRVLLGEFLFVPVRLQCNLSRVNCR